jgi:hypothetical protein
MSVKYPLIAMRKKYVYINIESEEREMLGYFIKFIYTPLNERKNLDSREKEMESVWWIWKKKETRRIKSITL